MSDDVRLAVTLRPVDARRSLIAAAAACGAEAINMRWMWWTRRRIRHLHDDGLLCFAYDAQRRFSVRRSTRLGVDGVFSDDVRLLASVGQ